MSEKKNTIRAITGRIIYQLYNNGNVNRGALATLRRTTSITDKGAEKIWPFIFEGIASGDKKSVILSKNGKPTKQESAIYTALHCYAIFQQGNDSDCVYASVPTSGQDKNEEDVKEEFGVTLFSALRQIRNNDSKIADALDRRVTALLATTNVGSAINSITHLVNILKGKKIVTKVDFAQLASDLNVFQSSSKAAREIALKWGQDYYWNTYQLDDNE